MTTNTKGKEKKAFISFYSLTDGSGRFRIEVVRWNAHMGRRRLTEWIASLVEELERRGGSGCGRRVMSCGTEALVALK